MRVFRAAAVCSLFVLASCGGGGGGNPTPSVPQPVNGNGGGIASSGIAKTYEVVDLGVNVQPAAINNHNAVVGEGASNGAFLYSAGIMNSLGELPGSRFAVASDINDSGTIIGTSYGQNSDGDRATLFFVNAPPQSLGTGNQVASQGNAVNNTGELVGIVRGASVAAEPNTCWGQLAIFDGHGGATQSGMWEQAVAVNSSGTVLYNDLSGFESGCNGVITAKLYPSNAAVPYPANQRVDNNQGAATDLNDLGDVVGSYEDGTNRQTEGFYDHNGTSIEILPPGNTPDNPFAINNEEVVVGSFSTSSFATHAFIWQNGTFVDLNTLLAADCRQWDLQNARDINDNGYIVGTAYLGGQAHGVLLIPHF